MGSNGVIGSHWLEKIRVQREINIKLTHQTLLCQLSYNGICLADIRSSGKHYPEMEEKRTRTLPVPEIKVKL